MDTIEVAIKSRTPDHYLVQGGVNVYIPGLGQTRISPFKVFVRSAVVIITTLIVSVCPGHALIDTLSHGYCCRSESSQALPVLLLHGKHALISHSLWLTERGERW